MNWIDLRLFPQFQGHSDHAADGYNVLDTTNIEAMSHAFPVRNVFREDIVQPSVNREDIILNAANKKEGCFKVPKAVE